MGIILLVQDKAGNVAFDDQTGIPTHNAYTSNAFPGAPVRIGKQALSSPSTLLGGIIINNKISNVGAKGGGINDAKEVCSAIKDARLFCTDKNCVILPSPS